MKRIILFKYHKKPLVCVDRLKMLKHYNPGIRIYGLYGGVEEDFPKYDKRLNKYFEHNYCLKEVSDFVKWAGGDLVAREWFKEVGKDVDFDMLNTTEWDLLFFDSLDNIYKGIPKEGVGLTALNPIKNVEHRWHWTSVEPYKKQWKQLLQYVKDKFNYDQEPYGSLGPGACFPRKFLEKYSSIEVPNLCIDEQRSPLFAQVLGFKLYDTGFYGDWYDRNREKNVFNCMIWEIPTQSIKRELKKKDGIRVFHPYYKIFKT